MYKKIICTLSIVSLILAPNTAFAQKSNDSVKENVYTNVSQNNKFNYGNFVTNEDVIDLIQQTDKLRLNNPSITESELNNYIKKNLLDKYSGKISNVKNSSYALNSYASYLPTSLLDLNLQEQALFNANLYQGIRVLNYGMIAKIRAEDRFDDSTLSQGNGDAFRHSLWNALMSSEFGQSVAKQWSDAHEYGTPVNDDIDMEMDLYNNGVGYRLGQYVYSGPYFQPKLESEIIRYINNGWMKRIINNSLTVTDSSGQK